MCAVGKGGGKEIDVTPFGKTELATQFLHGGWEVAHSKVGLTYVTNEFL